MALLTRVIVTYGLDLTIPISQVIENMNRAHHRDCVRQEKFYFRVGDEIRTMSMDEIINGASLFPGLVPLVQQYLEEHEHIDSDTRLKVEQYLSLISKRAAGILSRFCSL
jgi:glutamate--cysteine ligase catalytic subunit